MKMECVKANTTWSIVPDCGGLIERIAVSLPNKVFDSENLHAEKILTAIGNLLQAMPSKVSILVFTDACNAAAAENWLNTKTSCRYEIILAGVLPLQSADIWAQDSLLVQARGNAVRLAAPKCDWPNGILPALLSSHLSVTCHDLPLFLPGGDQIVGEDFRLVGQTSRLRSAATKFGGDGTLLEADRRISQLDHRPVCYWGYRKKDLTERSSPYVQSSRSDCENAGNAEQKEDRHLSRIILQKAWYLSRLQPDLVTRIERCESHVDRYVSPTGLRRNGKNLLLLADPVAVTPEAESKTKREKRLLDASEYWLRDQGFEIIRNPVPVATDMKNSIRPRLYNNILLENAVREGSEKPIMWLPCFGEDKRFADYDAENASIWNALGFEPRQVLGWESLAHANGALRCASKVISRLP
jgi:hypothetical protein